MDVLIAGIVNVTLVIIGHQMNNEEPLCPGWEEAPTPEDEYWDRYAWKEKNYDKDEAE